MLLVSACNSSGPAAPRPSGEGLCAGLEGLARDHAATLAVTTDEQALVTGDRLISGLIAGCGYTSGAPA